MTGHHWYSITIMQKTSQQWVSAEFQEYHGIILKWNSEQSSIIIFPSRWYLERDITYNFYLPK